jgi:hypothetical protein
VDAATKKVHFEVASEERVGALKVKIERFFGIAREQQLLRQGL